MPENIHFQDKDIYVYTDNHWLPTKAVHSDAEGLCVIVDSWMCGFCHYMGSKSIYTCENCGRRRSE